MQTSESAVALVCLESPDVRFEDVIVVPQHENEVRIDPLFIEVCEPNSIEVIGWSSDEPHVMPGFRIRDGKLQVNYGNGPRGRLAVKLSGLRKGMGRIRFAKKTPAQMAANKNFWMQAHIVKDQHGQHLES